MGKRKRRTDKNKTPISPPTPSDMAPHSHQMDSLSKEKSFRPVGTSTVKSQSSNMEIVDTSMKPPNAQQSPTHHHHHYHHHQQQQQQQQQHNYNHQNHQNRTLLSRHPRNYYGRQYSRRNSANHAANTSTYHRKGQTPLRNDKLSFKLAASTFPVKSQSHSDYRERAYRRPERIRSSLLGMETGISSSDSTDVMKMVCGICEKLLRKKPYIIENTTLSATDLSVVAVLVCGHLFHADCLETRTALQDRRDPPCPTCIRSTHIDLV